MRWTVGSAHYLDTLVPEPAHWYTTSSDSAAMSANRHEEITARTMKLPSTIRLTVPRR